MHLSNIIDPYILEYIIWDTTIQIVAALITVLILLPLIIRICKDDEHEK